jgi:hypothetical protein
MDTTFGRQGLVASGRPPRVLCGCCPRVGLHSRVTVAEDYDRTEAAVSSHHHAFLLWLASACGYIYSCYGWRGTVHESLALHSQSNSLHLAEKSCTSSSTSSISRLSCLPQQHSLCYFITSLQNAQSHALTSSPPHRPPILYLRPILEPEQRPHHKPWTSRLPEDRRYTVRPGSAPQRGYRLVVRRVQAPQFQ